MQCIDAIRATLCLHRWLQYTITLALLYLYWASIDGCSIHTITLALIYFAVSNPIVLASSQLHAKTSCQAHTVSVPFNRTTDKNVDRWSLCATLQANALHRLGHTCSCTHLHTPALIFSEIKSDWVREWESKREQERQGASDREICWFVWRAFACTRACLRECVRVHVYVHGCSRAVTWTWVRLFAWAGNSSWSCMRFLSKLPSALAILIAQACSTLSVHTYHTHEHTPPYTRAHNRTHTLSLTLCMKCMHVYQTEITHIRFIFPSCLTHIFFSFSLFISFWLSRNLHLSTPRARARARTRTLYLALSLSRCLLLSASLPVYQSACVSPPPSPLSLSISVCLYCSHTLTFSLSVSLSLTHTLTEWAE